jgi:LysR family nitrogen assimilation transcriptional regulator
MGFHGVLFSFCLSLEYFAWVREAYFVNLKQLRYFVTAVDLCNITRAAKKLHVAQPALGLHIRELEAELGVTLLHRHSRGVEPTVAGQLLYTRANQIFEQIEQTRKDVTQLHQAAREPVSLGLTTSLTLLVGTGLQLLAERDFEDLAFSLVEGPSFFLADAIEREELDVALAYEIEPRPGLLLTAVMEEEILYVTAAGRKGSKKAPAEVAMEEVLAGKLALGSRRDIGRRILARTAGVPLADLKVTYEVQSIAAIRDLVLQGEASSIMPYGSVARELEAGRLVARRIAGHPLKSTLYIVRRAASGHEKSWEARGLDRLLDRAITMVAEKLGPYGMRL